MAYSYVAKRKLKSKQTNIYHPLTVLRAVLLLLSQRFWLVKTSGFKPYEYARVGEDALLSSFRPNENRDFWKRGLSSIKIDARPRKFVQSEKAIVK